MELTQEQIQKTSMESFESNQNKNEVLFYFYLINLNIALVDYTNPSFFM